MAKTVLPITPAIACACDLLDEFVGNFITACLKILPLLGKYEAEVEAFNLFRLAIRDVEGVIELARSDLALLPPALAAARACFENAVKACWLVDADNPFDREARYLNHLKSEERYLQKVAERIEDTELKERLRRQELVVHEFRIGIQNKMPKHIKLLPGTPSFEEMLQSVEGKPVYPFYMMLSK
jgi:hypothetical protein